VHEAIKQGKGVPRLDKDFRSGIPRAVKSLQNRFNCSYARSLKDILFEATVRQDQISKAIPD